MLDHEGLDHEHFEELCALAAGGQLAEPEFVELWDHIQQCVQCRSLYTDFVDLVHNKLPLTDPELNRSSQRGALVSESTSYRERFLTRARKQGLVFSQRPRGENFWSRLGEWLLTLPAYKPVSAVAIVLLLAIVGVLSYSLRESNGRYGKLSADMAAMNRRIAERESSGASTAKESQSARLSPIEPAPALPIAAPSRTDPELAKARQDYVAAEALAKALQEQLQATALELQASRAQLEEASSSRIQLVSNLAEAQQGVTRVNEELQRLRQSRVEDASALAAQGFQIRTLSDKLTAQTEILERERTLLAAGRDIHDLMGARNLHIVDVYDVDTKGKGRRTFGRVFYTEEKSLIFYAFDLGDRSAARRNASFQAWGARDSAESPARSLGIFYVDDQKQNRWVLKFDDPTSLAEIDSVFVTVEPQGGSAKPTGRKFLYAYLKATPNHPGDPVNR